MSLPDVAPPAPNPPPGGNAAGCALFAIGLLMLIPSGLCTAIGGFLLVARISEGGGSQLLQNFGDLLPFVALTLVALGLGALLVRTGLRIRRP